MSEQHTRYQLQPVALASPGVDFITKSPNGPFIDTGHIVQFMEGRNADRVYLSVETLREMCQIAGVLEEPTSDAARAREVAIYNQGYSDAVKENIGGELRGIADRLGFVADRLGDFAVDNPAESEDGAEGTGVSTEAVVSIESKRDSKSGASVESAGTGDGQGTRSRGNKRSVGVSSDSGNDARSFRI